MVKSLVHNLFTGWMGGRALPHYQCPHPAGRGGTAAAAFPRRLCTGPACPLGCPFRCSRGRPTPGSSLRPSHRQPANKRNSKPQISAAINDEKLKEAVYFCLSVSQA